MRHTRGFTLLELLLFISASSILLVALSIFIISLLDGRVKASTMETVERSGAQVSALMEYTIRNAGAIQSPATGQSAASITLTMPDASKNPTIFSLSSGRVWITEGAQAASALTDDRITASGLLFQNLTRPNTDGSVATEFTLTHNNTSGKHIYDYARQYRISASLR